MLHSKLFRNKFVIDSYSHYVLERFHPSLKGYSRNDLYSKWTLDTGSIVTRQQNKNTKQKQKPQHIKLKR